MMANSLLEVMLKALLAGKTLDTSVDDPDFTDFYIEPGQMQIKITNHQFKQLKITGSGLQNEYKKFRFGKKYIFQRYDSLNLVFGNILTAYRGGDTSDVMKAKMSDTREKCLYYSNTIRELHYNYAIAHPDSYLSPIFLYTYRYVKFDVIPIDSALIVYNHLTSSKKESYTGKLIYEDIHARIMSSVGNQASVFKLTDWKQRIIDLSCYKGKSYVLLDFWASWCVACREATPNLKILYQKYHDKGLEVISLSSDDNKVAWRNAVMRDSVLMWKNAVIGSNSSIAKSYYVQAIPNYIIIDKEGKIAGRFEDSSSVEENGKLTKFLRQIFEQ